MENLDLRNKLETDIKDYIIKSRENLDEKFFHKYQTIM